MSVSTAGISSPTLIIHAKDDALVSYHHAENAHQKIPGSEVRLYPFGGHALFSQREKLVETTKKFIDGIDKNILPNH